jgi:uncharacterized protein
MKHGWVILAKLMVAVVTAMVTAVIFSLLAAPWFPLDQAATRFIMAQNAAFTTTALIFWSRWEKRSLWEMGFSSTRIAPSAGDGSMLGLFLIGSSFLWLWLTPWLSVQEINWSPAIWNRLGLSAITFFCVAVGEEIFNRGYVQGLLLKRTRPVVAIAGSSFVFALLHMQNPFIAPLPLLNLLLAGILLGCARYVSGNLWYPIGLHLTWNWTQEALSLPVSGLHLSPLHPVTAAETGPDWITGGPFGLEGGLAGTLAILTGIGWILKGHRSQRT